MNREISLKGKIALVTGATSGIGKAIVLKLAAYGCHLLLVGRDSKKLTEVSKLALRNGAIKTNIYQVDLENEKDIKNLISKVKKDTQGLDILIHAAGVIALGNVEKAIVADFDWQYRVNVRSPYLLTQIFLPEIKKRHGQIIFINSTAGLNAKAGVSQYSATKYALRAVADALRDEVNKDKVRVMSIFPGSTATPMQEKIAKTEGKKYKPEFLLQAEDVAQVVIDSLIQPKTSEITNVILRPFSKT